MNYQFLYPHIDQATWKRAQQIKLLVCDVDGVFSDGRIYLGNQNEELKAFHTRDGFGIKALLSINIPVAIITGRSSHIVQSRMEKLGITSIYQGCENKIKAFYELLETHQVTKEETAYIGDDLVDLEPMLESGLSCAVGDAHPIIQHHASFTTSKDGGFGAVRELCDVIMISQNKLHNAHGQSI